MRLFNINIMMFHDCFQELSADSPRNPEETTTSISGSSFLRLQRRNDCVPWWAAWAVWWVEATPRNHCDLMWLPEELNVI